MSRKATIPITNHNDGEICSLDYTVRYKLSSSSSWTTLNNQTPEFVGSPGQWAFTLHNLQDDSTYDLEITRNCCEGTVSNVLTDTIDTTL